MKAKTIISGTIVAFVSSFLLGGLIYGVLIGNIMTENCDQTTARPMEEFKMGAMLASNLMWGLLLTLIIYWRGIFTPGEGLKIGALLGLLSALAFDLAAYAMTTMFKNFLPIIADSIAFTTMFAISGALAAWLMARVNKPHTRVEPIVNR